MKDRNNRGFTLIELLVTLSIVAALSIVMGVGVTNIIGSTTKADYAESFKELFKNANIYLEYSTTTCDLDTSRTCNVTISELVRAGLIDSDYYDKRNPYKKSGNFVASDTIVITLNNGRKTAKYFNTSCGELNSENVQKFEHWGEC